MKGHNEHAFYLKQLMKLLPDLFVESRKVYRTECSIREAGYEEKAERFRAVKIELYSMACDCRIRNGELIEKTLLNRKERDFLRRRYIHAYTWKRLFNSQGYSPDHCKRIHRDAVNKVAEQFSDVDFKSIYEEEHARYVALMASIGEKVI